MKVPWSWQSKIYNVTELLEFTVTRVKFDGGFKTLHSNFKFYFLSSVRFSDFQWWSFENIKRQSKLILSSQIIISSLGLSSNFLTLVFTRHFSTEIWEQFTNHFPESPVKTSARWLEFPASLYKLVFPLPITLFLTPEFPRPSHALSSHVVKIPPKCGVTSGSHSSGVYYLK